MSFSPLRALALIGVCTLTGCLVDTVVPKAGDSAAAGPGSPVEPGLSEDIDGDGWTVAQGDCDDRDRDVFPGAVETCNGLDDNCNGVVDETFPDTDGDGTADCRDSEDCDGLDNDGDGLIDEDFADADGDGVVDCLNSEICDGLDNDGDGEIDEGFDLDGDGFTSCGSATTPADCDDTDPTVHPDSVEVDGNLRDDDCDGLVDDGGWTVADLVITEIMTNPDNVLDTDGEWVELYNASGRTLVLNGLVLYSALDGDYHQVRPDDLLVLEPGEYAVFGANANPLDNGGVAIDYEWSGFDLDNEYDGIAIEADGVLIDQVEWDDGTTFPDRAGSSMNLDPVHIDAISNDSGEWWCNSTAPWAPASDRGSPGADNQFCWPTAIAGYDGSSSLTTCSELQLDGSGSADPTGLGLSYEWELVSAPVSSALTTADIEDPTDMSPTFLPDVDGTYVFSLVVYNGFEYSPASVLAVTISLRTTNSPPAANAGEDETESSTVSCVPIAYGAGGYECPSCDEVDFELDGSASSDPDGDWVEVVECTVLTGSATITDEDTFTPTVTMGSMTATYGSTSTEQVEIQLEVVDCMGATDTDVIILTHQCTGG